MKNHGTYILLFRPPGAQSSKWYEISDMEIFQITVENPDPPTNQGAYFNILLSI